MGLDPHKHLGKDLATLQPTFLKLQEYVKSLQHWPLPLVGSYVVFGVSQGARYAYCYVLHGPFDRLLEIRPDCSLLNWLLETLIKPYISDPANLKCVAHICES
jgi:hypothetical protein